MVDIKNPTKNMIAKDKMEFEGNLFNAIDKAIKDLLAVKYTCKSYTKVAAVFDSICRHEFSLQVIEEVCSNTASYKIVSTSDKSQKAIKTGFLKFKKIAEFDNGVVHNQNLFELFQAILDIYKN